MHNLDLFYLTYPIYIDFKILVFVYLKYLSNYHQLVFLVYQNHILNYQYIIKFLNKVLGFFIYLLYLLCIFLLLLYILIHYNLYLELLYQSYDALLIAFHHL